MSTVKVKIDRQSRLHYIVVPDQKFYTREVDLERGVAEKLHEFYKNQLEVETFLKHLYLSQEGHAPEPETPECLKPTPTRKSRGKTQASKQQQDAEQESGQE